MAAPIHVDCRSLMRLSVPILPDMPNPCDISGFGIVRQRGIGHIKGVVFCTSTMYLTDTPTGDRGYAAYRSEYPFTSRKRESAAA